MKKIVMTIVFGLTMSISVSGALIYGRLKENGRSLPAKVKFQIACRDQVYEGETDNYGAYSANVGRGKCFFKLHYRSRTATFDLYPAENPLRYDFDLILQPDGSYTLRRK